MSVYSKLFPESAKKSWSGHHRMEHMRYRMQRLYYSMRPPMHLINEEKLIAGSIPVIINNFNRYKSLKILIAWILNLNSPTSILIIDNGSTYPPLVKFYRTLNKPNVQVLHFEKNHEISKILPVSMTLKAFNKYIVTDADLIPYPSTPKDILIKMEELLDQHPHINHVGASLEIEDIPQHYPFRSDVLKWESQYWNKKNGLLAFDASVDTTFGMYRKTSRAMLRYPALRLNRPYTLKHVDWYINPESISRENRFYLENCTSISTWNTKLKNVLIR